jgi:SAM-dependent methyltransferase
MFQPAEHLTTASSSDASLRGGAENSKAGETGQRSTDWRCPQCGAEPSRIENVPAFAPEFAQGAEGYDPAHFVELAQLEAGNFWFGGRNRLIIWALRRFFPDARSFLEVGCGTGFVLSGVAAAFPQLQLAGSEASVSGLAFAAQRVPGAQLFQMDARRIPYRDEFDVAGAFDVIEHIEDDHAVLRELHAAVVPGGGLVLTVPQHPSLWSEYDARAGHVRRYRSAELCEKVVEAGFEIVKMTSFVTLLLPFMYLSRFTQRMPCEDYDPLAELRIAPWLNRTLGAVLGIERAMIRTGVPMPAGGSLLVVARRASGER